ncbi:hypothetical protein THAOC_05070, partial [Thalassiosira oceanica]
WVFRSSGSSTRKVAASAGSPCPTALDSSPLGVDPFRAPRTGLESSLLPYVASQIKKVYGAMKPLVAYALAPMHLAAFHTPRGSGKTTWEPVSTSTSTATPCFRAEISGSEPPGTPQIQKVYGVSVVNLRAAEKQPGNQHPPQFPPQHPVLVLIEISGSDPPGTPQIQQVYGVSVVNLIYVPTVLVYNNLYGDANNGHPWNSLYRPIEHRGRVVKAMDC